MPKRAANPSEPDGEVPSCRDAGIEDIGFDPPRAAVLPRPADLS
jgi:hypothetical protein